MEANKARNMIIHRDEIQSRPPRVWFQAETGKSNEIYRQCSVWETIFAKGFGSVETPRKFIIAKLSIRKLGSSSVLIVPSSLPIESFAIISLRGVSTKLNCTINSRVVLTRWSHFNAIVRRVISTRLICRFDFNSRFDPDVGS